MAQKGIKGRPPHGDTLTPAEWRVVDGVRHGLSNPAIAARLGVSLDAVKFHVGNALGKLSLSSRADLKQWSGIRRDSAMATRDDVVHSEGLGAIGQISRHAADVTRAARWYGEVLGLPHLYTFEDLAFFDCNGTRLMIGKGDPQVNAILYFAVPDIAAEHQRLSASGVDFIAAPHRIHVHQDGAEEWMAFFRDSEGGTLALMCTVPGKGE